MLVKKINIVLLNNLYKKIYSKGNIYVSCSLVLNICKRPDPFPPT